MVSTDLPRSACHGCPGEWTPRSVVPNIGGMDGRQIPVGKFYDLIQQHVEDQTYPPSERQVARLLGVTPSTLANWRTPKQLIEKKHIVAVAELAGVRYERALDALLDDIGYRTERDEPGEQTA